MIENKKLRVKIINACRLKILVISIMPLLLIIKKDKAPKIAGILRMFENLAANSLLNPRNLMDVIIAPDRLTPGTSARH